MVDQLKKEPWQQQKVTRYGKPYKLWVLKVNGKYEYAKEKDALIDKVFDLLIKPQKLKALYVQAIIWKRDNSSVSDKTLKEYIGVWNRYFEDSELSEKNLSEITGSDWQDYFLKVIKENNLTQKAFSEIRGLTNIIYTYAAAEISPVYNPIRDLPIKTYPFRENGSNGHVKAKAFTETQVTSIKKWCREQLKNPRIRPLYPLAIQFNLYMGLRYAELAALQWTDIDFDNDTVTIQRQRVSAGTIDDDLNYTGQGKKDVEHQKQHVEPHAIYLSPEANIYSARDDHFSRTNRSSFTALQITCHGAEISCGLAA